MGYDYRMFLAAVKAILSNKKAIFEAAQTTEHTIQLIFSLIQSVLSAYEAIKFGTYSRAIPDEDANAIIQAYGKE